MTVFPRRARARAKGTLVWSPVTLNIQIEWLRARVVCREH